MHWWPLILVVVIESAGCGPQVSGGEGEGSTGPMVGSSAASTTTGGGDGSSESSISDDTSADTTGTPCEGAMGSVPGECDVWCQDCPVGHKCMPWADDGGGPWNAWRCSPVADAPGQPGDSCTAVGGGLDGEDDCVVGAMCWNIDPETGVGTCRSLCMGGPDAPRCPDPTTSCVISSEGVIPLCIPHCDPFADACQDGYKCSAIDQTCVPGGCFPLSDRGFLTCTPVVPRAVFDYGEPCWWWGDCDYGLTCVPAARIPGCMDASSCCTSYCDTTDPNASLSCPDHALGQICAPLFEPGAAPPDLAHVGACVLP